MPQRTRARRRAERVGTTFKPDRLASALLFPARRGGRTVSRNSVLAAVVVCLAVGPAAAKPGAYLNKPDAWFAGDEAGRAAANVLSYQSELGGWPKNVDTTAAPFQGDPKTIQPTFDNGATTDELRYLARIFAATKDATYRDAFVRGLDYVLQAQYANGGWPQRHPPGKGYHRHITF